MGPYRIVFVRAAGMAAAFALALATIAISGVQADASTGDGGFERARAENAESRHRAAVAAYARGRYRDAIDLFLEANRLRPSAALSFNIARCYEHLDDAASVLAWYRDYLRRSDDPSDAARVAGLIAKLEKGLAQKGVQQVSVLSAPDGATVLIDRTPVGVSPWTGALVPGIHTVDLTLAGYAPASERFELTPEHARDVELTLVTAAKQDPLELPMPAAAPAQLTLERQRVATTARDASSARDRDRASVLSTLGWIALGTGGTALAGALVFEGLRRSAEQDAEDEKTQIRFAQIVETMRSRQTVARVLGGTGAGLALVGGVLLLAGASNVEHAPGAQLRLSCTSSKCNAAVTGRF